MSDFDGMANRRALRRAQVSGAMLASEDRSVSAKKKGTLWSDSGHACHLI